jgi:hypothetical protein
MRHYLIRTPTTPAGGNYSAIEFEVVAGADEAIIHVKKAGHATIDLTVGREHLREIERVLFSVRQLMNE